MIPAITDEALAAVLLATNFNRNQIPALSRQTLQVYETEGGWEHGRYQFIVPDKGQPMPLQVADCTEANGLFYDAILEILNEDKDNS